MVTPGAAPLSCELAIALKAVVARLEPRSAVLLGAQELHIRVIDQQAHVKVASVVRRNTPLQRSQHEPLPETGRWRQPHDQPRRGSRQPGEPNAQSLVN